jgi:hypothetical protein
MEPEDLRDYFAGQALPTVLAGDHGAKYDQVAEKCYRLAEALIAEKKKRTPADPPEIEALEPPTAAIGQPSFTLHVRGKGFTPESVIFWNDGAEPTTFVSDTELTTGVNMETAQFPIPIPIVVKNADGTLSNEAIFTLTEASARGRR